VTVQPRLEKPTVSNRSGEQKKWAGGLLRPFSFLRHLRLGGAEGQAAFSVDGERWHGVSPWLEDTGGTPLSALFINEINLP
jgi:hypothetical protein